MARISHLPNVNQEAVATLERNNIVTLDDLWEEIGSDFRSGVARVVAMGIDEAQVKEILNQEAVAGEARSNSSRDRFAFFLSRHWREVLALVIAVVLLALLVRNVLQRRDTLVVTAPNGLPAFHVITADDVEPARMFRVDDSIAVESDVIGRYLVQPVAPRAVLLNSQLGPAHLKGQLNGRQVLTIPIKATAISSTIRAGSTVRVLFSPRPDVTRQDIPTTGTPDLIIPDVIVLAINLQGDSSAITVAFKTGDDLTKVLLLLSTSDLLISEG